MYFSYEHSHLPDHGHLGVDGLVGLVGSNGLVGLVGSDGLVGFDVEEPPPTT